MLEKSFFKLIRLNKKGQLTQGEWCITPVNGNLITKHCVKGTVDGPFIYNEAGFFLTSRRTLFPLLFPRIHYLKISMHSKSCKNFPCLEK